MANRPASKQTPGPKPKLSRAGIIDAAIVVLAEHGADAFTLRRLADYCGVTPMTLYGYFSSKEQLLDAVVASVLPAPPKSVAQDQSWSVKLRTCLVDIHESVLARPGVAALLAGRSLADRGMDALREYILEVLAEAGVPRQDRVAVLGVVIRYILGCFAVESGDAHHGDASETGRLKALPATSFPELVAVAGSYGDRGSHSASDLGIELLLMGIATFAVSRGAGG